MSSSSGGGSHLSSLEASRLAACRRFNTIQHLEGLEGWKVIRSRVLCEIRFTTSLLLSANDSYPLIFPSIEEAVS